MLSSRSTRGNAPAAPLRNSAGIAGWLCLAAAPTFAAMALLTAVTGGADMICSAMQGPFPLNGMATMYLLMSLFHLSPWLRLISGRANGVAGA